MRRIVSAVCCFIFLLVALSCEEKILSIKAEDGSDLLSRAARRSIESDFADFDFARFNIKPQWELVIKHQGNVMEVPFKYKDKSIQPRLKDYPGAKETSARLILSKIRNEVVAEVIYYFPSTDFNGEISDINLRNYKAMKFDGIFMFQQLGEDDIHLRFVEKGDIIKKRLGTKVSQAKNGRTMACQEWGVFWDRYENGVLVSSELLYTYNVCDGGGAIDEDQAPPEPGGGNSGDQVFASYIYEIENLLVKPCYRSVANSLFGWSSTNTRTIIGLMLSGLMPTTTAVKIYFEEENNPNKNIDGTYSSRGDHQGYLKLNNSALEYASQEYIAATLIHELVHGYYHEVYGTELNEIQQHTNMAQLYVDPMAQALVSMFGMSLQDATDLAWGGLQGTFEYGTLSTSHKQRIALTNGNYRTTASGSSCN